MQWITFGLEAFLILLTAAYVIITYRILIQMNKPYLSVYLEAKKVEQLYVMDLCVSNDGTGVANNVALVEVDTDRFNNVNIIQNGIPVLRQNMTKRIRIHTWGRQIDIATSRIVDEYQQPINIRITYYDFRNKKYEREVTLNFNTAYDFETTDE